MENLIYTNVFMSVDMCIKQIFIFNFRDVISYMLCKKFRNLSQMQSCVVEVEAVVLLCCTLSSEDVTLTAVEVWTLAFLDHLTLSRDLASTTSFFLETVNKTCLYSPCRELHYPISFSVRLMYFFKIGI